MIRSVLIGAIAGMRSLTPLAAVSIAAARGRLPRDNGAPALLGTPLAAAGTTALALAELGGDKMRSAPDRIVLAGLGARLASAAIAGAALAPRRQRYLAGALAAVTAIATSYSTWFLRIRAMERWGQTRTGLVEDAVTAAAAYTIVTGSARQDH